MAGGIIVAHIVVVTNKTIRKISIQKKKKSEKINKQMHRLCIGMAGAVIMAHVVVVTNKKTLIFKKKKWKKNKQMRCHRGSCCFSISHYILTI